MLAYVERHVRTLEKQADTLPRSEIFKRLGELGLDDCGEFLISLPNPSFPRLSDVLPRMASDKVQRDWTGNCGIPLLKQTLNFVRSMSAAYTRLTGRAIQDATVLDYGCGYGRIARMMYAYVDEKNLWGVDPWDRSIEICHEDGMGSNFVQSDYLPGSLPVGDRSFDLIYAFSVFTHLSERATLSALRVLRDYIKPNGVLLITIRPEEYWQFDPDTTPQQKRDMRQRHDDVGFAFHPHLRSPVDGDVTYGDTSMTLAWLEAHAPDWKIVGTDRSLEDSLQRYIFLVPKA